MWTYSRKGLQIVVLYFLCAVQIDCVVEFTNVKCVVLDKAYLDFELCHIKSVNRSYKYVSAKLVLLQEPIEELTIEFKLLKRENGYKPFLYHFSVDACKHFVKSSNLVHRFFAELFRPYTNLNHTCPYPNAVILEKIPASFLNSKLTKILPMPPGDYAFCSKWICQGIPRAEFSIYINLS